MAMNKRTKATFAIIEKHLLEKN